MRRIFIIISAVLWSTGLLAQSAGKLNYQTIVRNADNKLAANQSVGFHVSILQGSDNGPEIYMETLNSTTNINGLAGFDIGGAEGFSEINWSNGPYFLSIKTDPEGGTNYIITVATQILSIPYALFAKIAGSVDYNDLTNLPPLFNGDYNSLINKPHNISDFEMDANSRNISNISNPVNDRDAVTKAYVDMIINDLSERIEVLEMEN